MKAQLKDNQQFIIMALNSEDDDFVFKYTNVKPLKELIGSYKGIEERSYLMPCNADTLLLAKAFSQESVLKLGAMNNGKRKATILTTIEQRPILEGEFVNVGNRKPECDAWTFDIESGNYFIIK